MYIKYSFSKNYSIVLFKKKKKKNIKIKIILSGEKLDRLNSLNH